MTVPISETSQAVRSEQFSGVVRGEITSGNYFDMLGVHAAHGRVFTADDDRTSNAQAVVVISDDLWRARFNADPQTIGRITYLNRKPFTIIGILPSSFAGTVFANKTDFWAPVSMEAQLAEVRRINMVEIEAACTKDAAGKEVCGPGREAGDFRMLGRLKPGVTPEAASAQLTAIAANRLPGGPEVKPPKLENARDAFNPGFDADRMISMRLDPGTLGYKGPRIEAVYRDVLRLLKEVPRVESASIVSSPPFADYGSAATTIRPDGSPSSPPGSDVEVEPCNTGPGYFETMGIPMVAGRDFDERDAAGRTLVAILSDGAARRLFGSAQNAVGKRIRANEDGKPFRLEVVR